MYLASAVSSILSLRISRVDFIRGAFFGGHSEYVVEIDEMSGHRSTVSKRYRDFLEFHRQVSTFLILCVSHVRQIFVKATRTTLFFRWF